MLDEVIGGDRKSLFQNHLKVLLRDMLSDGGEEFFGREDLEVLPVAPVGHAGATKVIVDFALSFERGQNHAGSS
jgi:hypothetical protein